MIRLAILIVLMLVMARSRANEVRLAVWTEDAAHQAAADLLTTELSHQTNLVLLERAQLNKVRSELAFSAASGEDYLKLGQLVGADGLLLLKTERRSTNEVLAARLLAVKPGVILSEHAYPLPLQNVTEWSGHVVQQFLPFLPKLAILPKDAVPISVVSLRSALQSAESRDLEEQLAQLVIARLAREPEVFVLEREHLREASSEKEFGQLETESPFWSGRYLLEGTLDKEGFDPEKLTINARLSDSRGNAPLTFDFSGPRKDLSAVAEMLVVKILAGLHRSSIVKDWQPAAEAEKYFAEAQWARRWGLMTEAQENSETAWALGKQTRDNALLRLTTYMEDPALDRYRTAFVSAPWEDDNWNIDYGVIYRAPDPSSLRPLQRALELFDQNSTALLTDTRLPDYEWLNLGLQLVSKSSGVLETYYYVAEARSGHEDQLAEIRALTRKTVSILEKCNHSETNLFFQLDSPINLKALKWDVGGYWFERAEDTLEMQHKLLEEGFQPTYPPWVVGWIPEERKRVPALIKAFVENAVHSTNLTIHTEGLLMQVGRAPVDEFGVFQRLENELFDELWKQRHTLFDTPRWATNGPIKMDYPGNSLFRRVKEVIKGKSEAEREPFLGFEERLRMDMLQNPSAYSDGLQDLFPNFPRAYSEESANRLLPLVTEYMKQPNRTRGERYVMNGALRALQEAAAVAKSPESGNAPDITGNAPNPAAFNQPKTIPSALAAGTNTLLKFIPLSMPEINPEYQPSLQAMIFRRGKLWFQVRYRNSFAYSVPKETPALFVGINPLTGSQEIVPFPGRLGYPDPGMIERTIRHWPYYEVTDEALYVSVGDQLQSYSFREKQWHAIPVPMEHGAEIIEFRDKLYLNTGESVLELDPKTQKTKILASARRRPAENLLDEVGNFDDIFPGPGEALNVVAQRSTVYAYVPATGHCEKTSLSLLDADPNQRRLPGVTPGLMSRLQFEKDGQLIDPNVKPAGFASTTMRNTFFRCDLPEGRVVAYPYYIGYWWIPRAVMEGKSLNSKP